MHMALISIDPSRIFPVGDILTYISIGLVGPVTSIILSISGLGARIWPLTGVLSLIAICSLESIFSRIFVTDRFLFPSFFLSLGP